MIRRECGIRAQMGPRAKVWSGKPISKPADLIRNLSATVSVVLVGLAIGVLSMSPPEFGLARALLIGFAGALAITVVAWLSGSVGTLCVRISVISGAAILVFIGVPYTINWISHLERMRPSNVGVLPSPNVIISGRRHSVTLQIGRSDVFMNKDFKDSAAIFDIWENNQFSVIEVDGHIFVSTLITNSDGTVVAEMLNNEWKVAPSPDSWDRNYDTEALEVKDADGHIVLQICALPNLIKIQGAWWTKYHGRPELDVIRQSKLPGYGEFNIYTPGTNQEWPEIQPMFKYPSELHLHERR